MMRSRSHEHEHEQSNKPPALELLDEYWFFSNTLSSSNSNSKPPLPNNKDQAAERGEFKQSSPPSSGSSRRLLRTPSLPSPGRVDLLVEHAAGSSGHQQQQQQHQEEVEVEDDDLNWSSIYEGVLRTRMAEGSRSSSSSRPRPRPAALHRAPSMPVPAGGGGPASSTQQSKPRSNKPMSQKQLARSRSISVFQHDDKNKCRSSSDLESIEVQGFRDLGFVFDKDDHLRDSSLAGVLPGLKKPAGNSSSSRPPALVRVQSEARSAAEVKDQLRMWAQAVACNVRQEC